MSPAIGKDEAEKRYYIRLVLAALFAGARVVRHGGDTSDALAQWAAEMADALLDELGDSP